ncbi:MAG: phosphatidylinositol-specific phospholipase C domain-containing protein, partial [Bacteroidaceae bacterium]|nr:phosphatidylinositol-specific phospholipase C domain-containing protein [Bacteroidaceae bacterium]
MKKVLLVIFSFFVVLAAKAQVTNYQNWMAQLDDDAFVCQLSIPGAHDACSSSFSSGDAFLAYFSGKVQSKTIETMLTSGVRLFDLRPAVNGSKLSVYHGTLQTTYDFNPVMEELRDYVSQHPSEFCVVVMRHETDEDGNDPNFGSMLQSSLTQFSD